MFLFGGGKAPADPAAGKGKTKGGEEEWTGQYSAAEKEKYKSDFGGSGGLENQSVQDLQKYAAYKSEEVTSTVKNCLRIAEDIKEDANRTLVMLHQQGEQIERTHQTVVTIDQDLSRGEKLLGSLGGMFSAPWRPKKGHSIKGPASVSDDWGKKDGEQSKQQREKLGLGGSSGEGSRQYAKPTSAMEKIEVEKKKQDDGLSDLSDVLGQLKGMAMDMGSEMDRQNKALDRLNDDMDEMNNRVKGANQRARRLAG